MIKIAPKKYKNTRITTPTESYVTYYPQFIKLADTQFDDARWSANEIEVEKDKQDFLVHLTPSEQHAVRYSQKLFTKYELIVGSEHWLTKIMNTYPRPEVQRMASVFGVIELNVHAPFYDKLNKVLGADDDAFYTSYADDPALTSRIKFLDQIINCEDELVSLATFSMMEGSVLFSNFSFFKGFQSNGNNLIGNFGRGINQSGIDEGLHQTGGAMIFNVRVEELQLTLEEIGELHHNIRQIATVILEHEEHIIKKLFEKGPIRGQNPKDMTNFVKSRLNICMSDIGIATGLFVVEENPVADWFYAGIQKYQMNDFFMGMGREYTTACDETRFVWKTV